MFFPRILEAPAAGRLVVVPTSFSAIPYAKDTRFTEQHWNTVGSRRWIPRLLDLANRAGREDHGKTIDKC